MKERNMVILKLIMEGLELDLFKQGILLTLDY